MELTITKVGNTFAVILPDDFMESRQLKDGDKVYLTESPNGARLSFYDADLVETLAIAKRVMREDHEVLKKLAE